MLTIEQIQFLLRDRNLKKVSKECGLHHNTLYQLMNRKGVRYETVVKLSNYLEKTILETTPP